ncbi:hypothetical protein BESB_045260 [Besnoitia besnoiti]|uniref:Oligomerization domain protein n=1 Tax=Besnoitia besnoiti TaxID=94643 RepID=A0A2A9MGQ0_BESBE|nr:hypothetical protein BESB_045260 [Besnoitia besnoiti]PFH36334.1 hypothetical protein BESB_045260 [Besnoitia besnoiti]
MGLGRQCSAMENNEVLKPFAAAGFISSQLGQDHVYDGLSNAAALAVQRATRKPFRTTLPSRQDVRRHSWTADDEIRGHCAMPLVTGLVGSCDVNRTIPEFLLDPVFTAVRAADTHKAQSMVALWKKPGVPRVGWTEDMSCPPSTKLLHSSVSDPGSGCETFVSQPSDAWLDGTQRGQQADKASGGLTPQGEAMVIMTGTSASHLDSLAEAVIVAMWETHMRKLLGRDGRGYSGWIVLAFMDLEVHIMTPVTRERYALEELYKLCPRIDISDCIRVGSLEPFDLYRESFRTARDSHEPPFCSEEV